MLEVEGSSPCHCDGAASAAAAVATAAMGMQGLGRDGTRGAISVCSTGGDIPSTCRFESTVISRIVENGCKAADITSTIGVTRPDPEGVCSSKGCRQLMCPLMNPVQKPGMETNSKDPIFGMDCQSTGLKDPQLLSSADSSSVALEEGNAGRQEASSIPMTTCPAGQSTAKTQWRNYRKKDFTGVPLFVMLPLDVVTREGELRNSKAIGVALQALKSAGVEGVMVDVWWGLVEKEGPQKYNWAAYQALLQLVKKTGLLMQVVMSFHACGNNVGDTTYIPLPAWVHKCANEDPAIFFRDRAGNANPECVSFFSDETPCLSGRTPLQVYEDFMKSFKQAMGDDMDTHVCEVAVGMGPCGELRYPSYPEGDGRWRFPGIGEFQCYDARALACLKSASETAGEPNWGLSGPHDAGQYNMHPHQTGFFRHPGGSWETPYGQFFLQWYSDALVAHQERMLKTAIRAFHGVSLHEDSTADPSRAPSSTYLPEEGSIHLSIKCAGIHWWYKSASHAAELTAGYYNPRGRNGYEKVVLTCQRHGVGLNFTCVEMRNVEQPSEAHCGPEELLKQLRVCAAKHGVPFSGENALPRLDQAAYDQILRNATSTSVTLLEIPQDVGKDSRHSGGNAKRVDYKVPMMASVTFLRLTPQLFEEQNFARFMRFVGRLKEGGHQSDGEVDLGTRVRSLDSGALRGQWESVNSGRSASHGSLGLAVEATRSPVGAYRGSFSSNSSPQSTFPSHHALARGSAEFPHYPHQGHLAHHHGQGGYHSSHHYSPYHSASHVQYHSLSPTHRSSGMDSPAQGGRALSPVYLSHGRSPGHYPGHTPPGHPEYVLYDPRFVRK